jgi:hypothetical protein
MASRVVDNVTFPTTLTGVCISLDQRRDFGESDVSKKGIAVRLIIT